VFVEVGVADWLQVETTGSQDALELRGKRVDGDPHDNLCLRAVRGWRILDPDLPPVRVTLDKRVPIGSGMGGGSADAAFILAALGALSDRNPTEEDVAALAAQLGSDVPFFLRGGTAVCRGRGERIEPVEGLPRLWFAIVKPDASLSTAGVYSRLRLKDKGRRVQSFLQSLRGYSGGGPECFNRLESAAFELAPELRSLRDLLVQHSGVQWTMTGSGSAFFAVCQSRNRAVDLLQHIAPLGVRDVFVSASAPRTSMSDLEDPS